MDAGTRRHMPGLTTSGRNPALNGAAKDRSTALHDFEPNADIWNVSSRGAVIESTTLSTVRVRENGSSLAGLDSFDATVRSGSRIDTPYKWDSPWGTSTNPSQSRTAAPSPPRRPSVAQAQSTQQLGGNSAYFTTPRPPNLPHGAHPGQTKSRLNPTSVDFTLHNKGSSRINGFANFGFNQAEGVTPRHEPSMSPWSGPPSVQSPGGDRATSDYFGPSSGAPSQSGSLPPSRHGEPPYTADPESYAQYFQSNPRQPSSFSQPSGQPFGERSGSMQSERFTLSHMGLDQHLLPDTTSSRPSTDADVLALLYPGSRPETLYTRDSSNNIELLERTNEGMHFEPESHVSELSMQQLNDLTLRFRGLDFDSHSASNGMGARQSPQYSTVPTPPTYDPLYPSRNNQERNFTPARSPLADYRLPQQHQQFHRQQQMPHQRRNFDQADYTYTPAMQPPMGANANNLSVNQLPAAPGYPMHSSMQNSTHNGHQNSMHNGNHDAMHNGIQNSMHNGMPNSMHNGMPNSMHNGMHYGMHNPMQNPMHMAGFAPNGPFQSMSPAVPMATPPRGPREHNPHLDVMSPLLKTFRNQSPQQRERWTLERITNHVVEFAGDQNGSRFIQSKLREGKEEKKAVFAELQGNALPLMKDVYGNYVIQNFFQYGDQTQKKFLAHCMKGQVVELSRHTYACRVVQTALAFVLTEQQMAIVCELKGHVLDLVKDQNGNHVIQQAVERVPPEHIQFIFDAFRGQVGPLAHHQYGCRVIQRMLEHCASPVKRLILDELRPEASRLIADQFGNYVTQHIIEFGEDQDRAWLIPLVMKDLLHFCKHKHASNVVEKCLAYGAEQKRPDVCSDVLRRVTEPTVNGDIHLTNLIRDQYANYVIQRLLECLTPLEYQGLDATIRSKLREIKESGTAAGNSKQVMALQKKLAELAEEAAHRARRSIASTADSVPEVPPLLVDIPSPQSSSLPSGNVSTTEDPVHSDKTPTAATVVEIANSQ